MGGELIGRAHPAGVLRAEISRAVDSHGGLVLVTGEAGIGKTTLVTDAVDEARARGALVLSGSCWDSTAAPGFWPWVQVVRALRRHEPDAAAGEELSILLGEERGGKPADGFGMYDAVTSALVAAAQRRPVVVVIDDLHWADPSSVRLLEFVAQHTWFERLLLIGTYRDVEVETADHPLAPLMLTLLAKATTVTLTGLGRAEVGALMARTVGVEPAADLVTEVHLRTGGNPFFVEETARLWQSGAVDSVAPGVRAAVRRRLSSLPDTVSGLLTSAAVLGREFHRQVLGAAEGAPVAQVDRQLAQAVAARLVVALGDGRFAFAHDLVRETLYDELGPAAGERHAAVVRAIGRSPALAERIFPADLARHAYLGRAELDPADVVARLVTAAKDARRRFAFEESARHNRRAIELLDPADPKRARIGLELGLQLHHLGSRDAAWEVFDDVAAIALTAGDGDVLTRTALTLYGLESPDGRVKVRQDLMRAAHRWLSDGADPPENASLDQLAQDVILRLVALARDDGDDDTLGFTLWTKHDTLWGPSHAAERLALTDELAGIARRTGDHEMEQYAVSLGWVAKLELNDPSFHDNYLTFLALSERFPNENLVTGAYVDRTIIAAFQGRFDEAAAHLAYLSKRDGATHFAYVILHLKWARLMLLGKADEASKLQVDDAKHPFPELLAGITAATRGDRATALRCLAELTARPAPPPSAYEPLMLRLRAQVAIVSGEPDRRATARAELAPHVGSWLVSMYGCDISGPVALWLARLDLADGAYDSAVPLFEQARDEANRLGSRPWSLEARAGLADALAAQGKPVDELRAEVATEAAALGLRHLAATETPAVDRAVNEFRQTGDTWSLSMAGRTVHLPDSKGLRDLRELLRTPGKEIPAVKLLNPSGGAEVAASASLGGDRVLDDQAKAAYRKRLSTLDEQIESAQERGDDAKAAAYDAERAALLDELRAAAGLGGRARRLGDEAERARKTVTARIRDTLRKLDTRHPELAAHLRESVATGATCGYTPSTPVSWHL